MNHEIHVPGFVPVSVGLILLFLFVLAFGLGGFWWIGRDAQRVHARLNDFHACAQVAFTQEQLRNVLVSLNVYCAKNIWHQHLGAHAREVRQYIEGRLAGFTNLSISLTGEQLDRAMTIAFIQNRKLELGSQTLIATEEEIAAQLRQPKP